MDILRERSSTYLKVNIFPLTTCEHKEVLQSFCFWSNVKYQVKEGSKMTRLGTLSFQNRISGCNLKNITYNLQEDSDFLVLYPPSNTITYWSIGTKKSLDRKTHGSKVFTNIICSITGSSTTIFEKMIRIDVLDIDNHYPLPQEQFKVIYLNDIKIKKGHTIDNLLFFDNDSLEVNNYNAIIEDETFADFFSPNCDFYPDTRNNESRTTIHCKVTATKNKKFDENMKSSFLLILNDTSLEPIMENTLAYVNVTFDLGQHRNIRGSSFFRTIVKIFRTAAPFARVIQPTVYNKNAVNYSVGSLNSRSNPFQITREGIVYVSNTHILRSYPVEFVRIQITWIKKNITQHEEVTVRIVDEPNQTCLDISMDDEWTFCSQYQNQRKCLNRNSCALGTGGILSVKTRTGPHRCMWRGDKNPGNHETHLYSTCTPDIHFCPNGICDSLEEIKEDEICPQDCSRRTTFPTKLNSATNRGVDKCNGILICDIGCYCIIKNGLNETQTKLVPQINSIQNHFLARTKCGFKCILGSAVGIFVLSCIAFAFIIYWRIANVKKLTEQKCINESEEAEAPISEYIECDDTDQQVILNFQMTSFATYANCTIFKQTEVDPKWECPRSQIVIDEILAEGEFGKVLKATALNIRGSPGYSSVAVKTLKDDARQQDLNDLYSEYLLLKELSHPHVIKLLGVCTSEGGPLYIIIEYAEHGSLRNYLRRSRRILTYPNLENLDNKSHYDVTIKEILSFARQITHGMSYLSDIKLVHRDLAARNILLAENKICKISDFGLTRDIYEDNAYFKKSKGRVPVKWMAPESLADHVYTTKSDVWSFGILIWELVTLGETPYPGIEVQNLYNLLKQGYRMEKPPNCFTNLYSIMIKCWNIDPDQRPSFSDLFQSFDKLLAENINYLTFCKNAITNKSYFCDNEDTGHTSEDVNFLKHHIIAEDFPKLKIGDNLNQVNFCVGYETPIKNATQEEYTDMN